MNAADDWRDLADMPQVHFVGANDGDVSPAVQASYAAGFPPHAPLRIETIAGFDHRCCWVERWPALLERARRIAGAP